MLGRRTANQIKCRLGKHKYHDWEVELPRRTGGQFIELSIMSIRVRCRWQRPKLL
jgi:hypothetical protein